MTLDNILEEIKKANSIVLLAHENPDGDAVGSCLAMELALESMGKKVDLIMPEYPKEFEFLPGANEILKESTVESYDLAIALDCASTKLMYSFINYFDNAKVKVVIDHHGMNSMYGDFNYVDQEAPACSQLLFVLLNYFNIKITKDIATCLAAGIITDTNGFRNDSVTSETFRISAELCDIGINMSKIYQKVFCDKSRTRFETQKLAQNRIEFLEGGKVAYTYISKEDEEKLGSKNGDYDGIVNIGLNVEGVEVSMFIRDTPRGARCSLRAKDYVNVAEVALMFGGGGHIKAAACTIQGTIDQAKTQILNRVRACLK